MPLRVIELRQALHDMDDNDVVSFMSDDGQEFNVGAAVHLPEFDILYFGETQPGLEQALAEIEALLDDNEDRLDEILAAANEDGGGSCAVEGSDLGARCSINPEPDRAAGAATEEL